MNIGGQQVAQRVVDEPVPGHGAQPLEAGRGDPDVKVAAAIPGPGMPGMEVAFVGNFQKWWIQCLAQATLDHRDAVNRGMDRQGNTWMNGFTRTSAQTPDST